MSSPSVPVRKLGSQGLQASVQGLGCMGMSAFYTAAPQQEEESIATIHRALELGVTHLDTSDVYGPFTNEVLVGKAIKGQREKFTIATKCGIILGGGGMSLDGSRKHVRESCEGSLKRLGIDTIDLYYLHRVDPSTPVSETFAEMAALVAEGKVKYVGISEASPADIREAHKACPLTAVQLEWSLWSRDSEAEIIPTCRELGIGIVAYSPLGRGFLTGAITKPEDLPEDDYRRMTPRFQGDAFKKNLELVAAVKAIAQRKGVSPGQLALAWVHAQGEDVFTIPGTKRVKYLEENVGALAVQLTADELKELESALPAHKVVGGRY
uniref:NADP-dependent oxidoreductase domain-containing protein n=1 Tax=Tetradesmus obliquus TaxID=3088 RepID=A0A383V8C3_TETOB|eukprot:jgi/Sobl393_1/10631/SZX74667.1